MNVVRLPLSAGRFLSSRIWRFQPEVSVEGLIVLASLFFALACNRPFLGNALATNPGKAGFVVALLALLITVHALLLGVLLWRWNAKLLLTVLLVTTALATHYMDSYGVYLDADMVRNILSTDSRESRELLTPSLLPPLLLHAALPIAVLWRLRLRRRRPLRALLVRSGFLAAVAIVGAAGLMSSFQDLAALFRNHREIRHLATPMNYILALPRGIRSSAPVGRASRTPVGEDAVLADRSPASRPRLLVIVVGETVRAQNWGLNGYSRQTTPGLARTEDVINFGDFHACGTNTEVSLPCMFSPFGRRDYDEKAIRSHESLLHVLERAGVATLWRDNQSGCKGVCGGLDLDLMADSTDPQLCTDGRCLDEILLHGLAARVRARSGDRVVVLHQLGSHGPAYFQRYPGGFRRFMPTCDTADLGRCSRDQIVNAYDNSVLYTDHFLVRTLDILRTLSDYDTAMIYLSDHGESLGEKGLFLHGMPYAIAPREQLQIPMVMWFSPGFASERGLDLKCLAARARQRADHDDLFSSVLGLMQVRTRAYDRARDLFAACASAAAGLQESTSLGRRDAR